LPSERSGTCPAGSSPYVLDFYCVEKRLVVEADGSQHVTPEGLQSDAKRTYYLERRGLRVLRFTNLEILRERDGVLAAILEALAALPARESPSP